MKAFRFILLLFAFSALLSSCSVWNRVFPPKYGCGTNGKNVGAEKIIDGSYSKKTAQVQGLMG